MTVAITRSDRSAHELREVAARTQDAKAARRMLAIALVLEGWSERPQRKPVPWTARLCVTGSIATTQRDWKGCSTSLGAMVQRHVCPPSNRPR